MGYWSMMSKDVKNVYGNPGHWRPILVLNATKNDRFIEWKWTSIPRVPIYIFDILRHHASLTYVHFLWRTHCSTENGFRAAVSENHSTLGGGGWNYLNFLGNRMPTRSRFRARSFLSWNSIGSTTKKPLLSPLSFHCAFGVGEKDEWYRGRDADGRFSVRCQSSFFFRSTLFGYSTLSRPLPMRPLFITQAGTESEHSRVRMHLENFHSSAHTYFIQSYNFI